MAHSELISTAELAGMLTQPDFRLYDCTTYLDRRLPAAASPISSSRVVRPSRRGIFQARISWIYRASSPTRPRSFAS